MLGLKHKIYDTPLHVANSFDALAFLQGLPVDKQQPNLLFATFRRTVGARTSTSEFDAGLAQHGGVIRALMLARSTQASEPADAYFYQQILEAVEQGVGKEGLPRFAKFSNALASSQT